MTILVAGATGRIGRHLVDQLHTAGHPVRALTRDASRARFPDGVEVVEGDLADAATLHDAFDSINGLHLITFAGQVGADLTNGAELVALAAARGVQRVTVLSGWQPTSVESALDASDLSWTLLAPVEIMYNTFDWQQSIKESATVGTLGTWPSAMVHEADIAAVAMTALTTDGHGGQQYLLTGPQALTPAERTAILAAATGRDLHYVQLTEEQERARLLAQGYDEDWLAFCLQLATDPPEIGQHVQDTVQRVTGVPARTFAQWAQENAAAFR